MTLGGLRLIMRDLNHTSEVIRSETALVLGSSVQGWVLYLFIYDMYTMQISLFVYDLNNDLLPKSFRNLLSQNCLARHGIITRQNNLIPQSRPRTTFSSKLPKHNFTRIWNKTGSTLAHGKNRLTFKRLLKNSYLEAYKSHI